MACLGFGLVRGIMSKAHGIRMYEWGYFIAHLAYFWSARFNWKYDLCCVLSVFFSSFFLLYIKPHILTPWYGEYLLPSFLWSSIALPLDYPKPTRPLISPLLTPPGLPGVLFCLVCTEMADFEIWWACLNYSCSDGIPILAPRAVRSGGWGSDSRMRCFGWSKK